MKQYVTLAPLRLKPQEAEAFRTLAATLRRTFASCAQEAIEDWIKKQSQKGRREIV